MIVDDSALVRQAFREVFSSDMDLEVIGSANDPYMAVTELKKNVPDVITLDIEMPRMNGITFLKKLMLQHPIPVVVISTLTQAGTLTALKAMEHGAVEILPKPQINTQKELLESATMYCEIVKSASRANLKNLVIRPKNQYETTTNPINRRLTVLDDHIKTTNQVIAIGASTGGTEGIKTILSRLPIDCPGLVIVQHMPKIFTRQFADRLNSDCAISVKEAEDGDSILKGQALIAQGDKHLLLKRSGARYYVRVKEGPLVNRHIPSVDVLFKSVARYAGNNAIGVIMTGMGSDGAIGMLEMKKAGAYTIAQNEASCVVFGMPKEAILLKAVDCISPLNQITENVLTMVNRNQKNIILNNVK